MQCDNGEAGEREEDCCTIQAATDDTQAQGQQIQFREQKCEAANTPDILQRNPLKENNYEEEKKHCKNVKQHRATDSSMRNA